MRYTAQSRRKIVEKSLSKRLSAHGDLVHLHYWTGRPIGHNFRIYTGGPTLSHAGECTTAMQIRLRLGTLGEIVPILFDEANHYRVLFRVGDRLYFCKSKNEDPMADYDDDFDDYYDIIGIFPITYTQFLETSPTTIAELIDDR